MPWFIGSQLVPVFNWNQSEFSVYDISYQAEKGRIYFECIKNI